MLRRGAVFAVAWRGFVGRPAGRTAFFISSKDNEQCEIASQLISKQGDRVSAAYYQ
jgi:hypothetical protein